MKKYRVFLVEEDEKEFEVGESTKEERSAPIGCETLHMVEQEMLKNSLNR